MLKILLPYLIQLDQEQTVEKEIEAKRQGIFSSILLLLWVAFRINYIYLFSSLFWITYIIDIMLCTIFLHVFFDYVLSYIFHFSNFLFGMTITGLPLSELKIKVADSFTDERVYW
jgi:hypothetical protein